MNQPTLEKTFSDFTLLSGKKPLQDLDYWWRQELKTLSGLPPTPEGLGAALEATCSQLHWQGLVAPEFRIMLSYDDIAPQARLWERLHRLFPLPDPDQFVQDCARALPASRLYRYLSAQACLRQNRGQLALEWIEQALSLSNVCTGSQKVLEEIVNRFPEVEDRYHLRGLSEYLRDKTCQAPFAALSTGWAGRAFLCQCPSWLPYPSGNVLEATGPGEIWNSEVAQELRKSVSDGSFRHCSKTLCSAIQLRTLPVKEEPLVASASPRVTMLNHDNSCNLTCPSCRTQSIMAGKEDLAKYQHSAENVILPLLEQTFRVHISNGGEPFASRHYRQLLKGLNRKRFPHLSVVLMSNATLVTEELWQEFPDLAEMVFLLSVSIDAADAATYTKLRRSGKWADLCRGMDFIAELRRTKKIPRLRLNFVVQRDNFRQIPAFLELGKKWSADYFWFQRLYNYGTFSEAEFAKNDVCNPEHPDHAEFLALLPQLIHPHIDAHMFATLVPDLTLYDSLAWSAAR